MKRSLCVGSLDDHVTTRPVRTLPLASLVVAVNWCVRPTVNVADDGLTVNCCHRHRDGDRSGSRFTLARRGDRRAATPNRSYESVSVHGRRRRIAGRPRDRPAGENWLFESLSVAVSCCVEVNPRARVAEDGLTVTVATGIGLTVITGVATLGADSLLAVMIAVPKPAAVTVMVAPAELLTELAALTVSTAGLLETQLTVRPGKDRAPGVLRRRGQLLCLTQGTTGVVGAESVSAATGTGTTVRVALPFFLSLVAVMLALPAAIAVTRPVPDTVAAPVLSEVHVMVRPASRLLLASRVVAVACVVWPIWI